MKVDFKKLAASALSVAMIASVAGCAMFDKDDDAVLEVAEDYATAVVKVKPADIVELLADPDSDLQSDIEAFVDVDPEFYGEDYAAICDAIAGTLSFEIDEESVESSKKAGEASVDITFSIADYQAAYDEVSANGGDLDAFIDAIGSADANEITQTIEFVLEDDAWLVDDSKASKVQDLYQFYLDAFDFTFAGSISTDMIDYVEWYYSDNGVYTDENTIELDIIPTTEGQEIEWEFYYEYYLDGELVYTSDACVDSGYWIESYYGPSYDPAAATNDSGNLIAGQYRCIVYDMSGNVLADETCTVENGSSAGVVPAGNDDIAAIWSNGVDEYWYSYSDGSGYAMGEGDYTTDESVIEYTVQVYDEDNLAFMPVYYEVYYSANGNADDAEFIYSATITPSEYTNGYFYEFQYVENGGLDAGTYYFLGAPDANSNTLLFNAEATVS